MSLPLWKDLPRAEYYRCLERFAHLDPAGMDALEPGDLSLLMQWTFEQHGLETSSASAATDRLDLRLFNLELETLEHARIWFDAHGTPVNAVLDLLRSLEGEPVQKMRLYTLGELTGAQRRFQAEFPLTLDLKDRHDLVVYVQEAQRLVHQHLASRRRFAPVQESPNRRPQERSVWSALQEALSGLFSERR